MNMDNKIIKIQRLYRTFILKNRFKKLNEYNLINNTISFNDYTQLIRKKDLLDTINHLIKTLNNAFEPHINMSPRILLTSFLIKNYTDDILGKIKDRNPIDIQLFEWSNKLVSLIKNYNDNNYMDFKLFHNFLINYKVIFDYWKNIDKDRTIQNIIISYHNRRKHLEYIKNEEMNPKQKKNTIDVLNKECDKLLQNIKIIDKKFNIKFLQENYEKIYTDIKEGMEQILFSVSKNFKVAYLDMLINEFKNSNKKIIYDFILETNERLITLSPQSTKSSISKKFNSYNYLNILLEEDWNDKLLEYINFTLDTVIVFSAPEDDKNNVQWKNAMNSLTHSKYYTNLPIILMEINNKIDKIYSFINKII